LRKRLAGDLDAVLLKALEKQPYQRYRSVDALDAELARHLEGKPIEARRPLPFEMARRFAARYFVWVAVVVGIIILMCTGLIQVHREVLALGGGMAAGMLLMLAAYSSEFGGAVAKRLLRISAATMFIAGGLGGLLAVSIPKNWRPDILSILNLGIAA